MSVYLNIKTFELAICVTGITLLNSQNEIIDIQDTDIYVYIGKF